MLLLPVLSQIRYYIHHQSYSTIQLQMQLLIYQGTATIYTFYTFVTVPFSYSVSNIHHTRSLAFFIVCMNSLIISHSSSWARVYHYFRSSENPFLLLQLSLYIIIFNVSYHIVFSINPKYSTPQIVAIQPIHP